MSDDTPNEEKPDTPDDKPKTGKKKPTGKRQQRQATAAAKIYTTLPTSEEMAFQARELILCTLPHSDPGDVPAWSRTNGNLTLGIQPGFNYKTGTSYGIPYGIIPRLILVWMVTEIIRTRSRQLSLGNSLSEFLEKLGLSSHTGRGPRGDARRVREQMERLFRATISFEYSANDGNRGGRAWLDMKIAPDGFLCWDKTDQEQKPLWGSWIEVGEKFHKAVLSAPSPLDIRVLRHIKDSSLGIDLYTILNREAFCAMKNGKPRFLAWEWLLEQTGNEYGRLDNFRNKALEQIEVILQVHPGLIITVQKGRKGQQSGLWISNLSTPSIPPEKPRDIPPRLATAAETANIPMVGLPSTPPRNRLLNPFTVDHFRTLYPNLDPYACKADFDAWQEKLPLKTIPSPLSHGCRGVDAAK